MWPSNMSVTDPKSEILQGTLDLMVLQTLDAMGPLHGYGVARRIEVEDRIQRHHALRTQRAADKIGSDLGA